MPENTTRPLPAPVVHAEKDQLLEAAGARLALLLADLTREQERVDLSLTGGSLGIAIWKAVAAGRLRELVRWDCVHLWWSDERFLPEGDGERNDQQALDAFFAEGPVPADQIHRIGSADRWPDQHQAAEDYARELREATGGSSPAPEFDLSLLGMGPDGHIASLFPGREEILLEEPSAVGVEDSPKPPPARISMTLPIINRSRRIWFLIGGADKAPAVGRLLAAAREAGRPTDETLRETPASGARGTEQTLYLLTRDALPEDQPEHAEG